MRLFEVFWNFAFKPALAAIGGQALLAFMKFLGFDAVAYVQAQVPKLGEHPELIRWTLAFLIGAMIWGAGHYFLSRRVAGVNGAGDAGGEPNDTPPAQQVANDDEWLPVREAAKLLRDNLDEDGLRAAIVDVWVDKGDDVLIQAIGYLKKGVDHSIIEATGVPDNGMARRPIPAPISHGSNRATSIEEFVGNDGRAYRDVEIRRSTIFDLAAELNKEDDQPETGPEDGKD